MQGGRIFKHETFEQALQRLAKREIGSEIKIIRQIGAYEFHSDSANFDVKTGTHDVAVVFLAAPINDDFEISLDETHSKLKWVGDIDSDLHPYVKRVVNDSGVFRKV